MDFDFALILFIAVLITGLIWLIDARWWRKRRSSSDKQPLLVEYSISFFPVLLIVFLLRSFLYEPFQIPSGSMIPTLEVGDFILVNKYTYGIRLPVLGTRIIPINEPERGEVMVFIPPHDSRYFIKRVIGLPGDMILIEDNQVSINGEALAQRFVTNQESIQRMIFSLQEEQIGEQAHMIRVARPATQYGRHFEYRVPEGHYFMMGDNRDNSLDSREWGPVPEANIVGKAVAIWMHWEPWSLPSFGRAGTIN
jgi:signal peptidase I